MSPRIIQMPLSGGDRKHYARELHRTEQLHRELVRKMDSAYATAGDYLRLAHRLACEEWNARQFIGGPAEPSPTIAEALDAGRELLEVRCMRCGHSDRVDLRDVVWPRVRPIHTLASALGCQPCKRDGQRRRAPDLVALCTRNPPPDDEPRAMRAAKRTG